MSPFRFALIALTIICFFFSNIPAQSKLTSENIKDFKTSQKLKYREKIKSLRMENRDRADSPKFELRKQKTKWYHAENRKNRSSVFSVISLKKTTGIEAIPSTERTALIVLYNNTDGDNWTNNSGWKTPPLDADGFAMPGTENTWTGITVDADHVVEINLTSNNLSGTIPTELADLSNLVILDLSENNLTGSIPVELGGLTNLEQLMLNTNQLSGPIPSGIADSGDLPALWGLDLGSNNFDGNIPAALGNLSALEHLYLDYNELTGSVPAELGNLSNLIELDLYYNELDGIIEPGIADVTDLPNLEYLDFAGNYLTGSIPPELGNLSSLVELYLDDNYLSGSIPAQLGNLINLELLILEYNELTGSIPAGIGNLSNLQAFVADNNKLTGNIPPELGDMNSLIELDLWNNQLNGSIPVGMFDSGDLPNLVYLDLSTNQLTGAIPASIANLNNLQLFAAVENQLDTMPEELGDLPLLLELYLFDNKISEIPAGMLEPSDFPNLYVLDLCINEIAGPIPTGFENLPHLSELYLEGNKFSGEIPPELMNIAELADDYLDIRWNALYTENETLRTFLATKQEDGDWESTQTIAPTNVSPGKRLNSVSYIKWDPIMYTDDTGGYDVYYSVSSGGPYTFLGSADGKTTDTYGCKGLPEHSSYYFVVKARTNPHNDNNEHTYNDNNNTVISEYSNETYIADMNYSSYPEVVTNTGASITEGGQFTFSDLILKSYDEDAEISTLIYSIISSPKHGEFVMSEKENTDAISFTQNDIANGKVKYIHNGDNAASDYFTFIVSDIEGHSTQEEIFTININDTNDPPVFVGLPELTINEDEEGLISFTSFYDYVTDPDDADSTLTYIIKRVCDNIEVSNNDTCCFIRGCENWFGVTSLRLEISDGEFSVDTTIILTVLSVNDLPILSGLQNSLSFVNGEVKSIDLRGTATDIETPDTLLVFSFSASSDSVNVSYNAATKTVSFSAKGSFDGEIELTVTVTDEDGGTASEIISVTITPDPTSVNGLDGIPKDYTLFQNYPNPFNPSTVIRYGIPTDVGNGLSPFRNVSLKIYDILGNEVATLVNEQQSPGYYEPTWNAKNMSSGIYFYVLQAGSFTESRKLILLK